VPPGKRKRLRVETTRNAFAYVFAGSGTFRDASDPQAVLTESGADPNAPARYDAGNHSLVLFDRGDEVVVRAGDDGIRFLVVSGQPIEEPVVRAVPPGLRCPPGRSGKPVLSPTGPLKPYTGGGRPAPGRPRRAAPCRDTGIG
jgi:hypothetical protein